MRARMPSPSTPLPFLVSTAHFDALATNNSLGCLLNASRPTEGGFCEVRADMESVPTELKYHACCG